MAVAFLNRLQREYTMVLLNTIFFINEDILTNWKLDKKYVKELKTARSFILRFVDSIIKPLDTQQRQRILKDAESNKVICVPKYEAQIKKELTEEAQARELIQVRRGAIELLAENALGHCNPCKAVCEACILKQVFIELNIPPLEEVDQSPDCPYKYK